MTDIDVPLWVVDKALDAWDELSGHPSEEHRMRSALRAALSAWVVPAGYVSRKALAAVNTPPFYGCDTYISAAEQTYVVSDQIFTLRQEKPE